MTRLAYTRSGSGAPLVLLHGIGCARQIWDPVIPQLAAQFDVIAVDLPGFGASSALPSSVEPTPAALARTVREFLNDLDVVTPHIVGNSLGGWVALELAQALPVASVTLISPAGLWHGTTPLYCRASLRTSRWLARHASGALDRAVTRKLGRILALGQSHARPSRLSPEYARATIHAMGTCPGFDATLRATAHRCYRAGPVFDAPVTVAFGDQDRLLLPRQSRYLDQLPPGTHVGRLPACGHMPMADNPDAVVALIVGSAARADGGMDGRSVRDHMSSTMSVVGVEQQISTCPSSGGSSGAGE